MTHKEKKQIQELPQQYRPLGAWAYVGYNILFAIPIVGLICMIIFALSDSNIVRRSYARSIILTAVISAVIAIILAIVLVALGYDISSML